MPLPSCTASRTPRAWDNDGDGDTPEDGDCDDNNADDKPGCARETLAMVWILIVTVKTIPKTKNE